MKEPFRERKLLARCNIKLQLEEIEPGEQIFDIGI